MAARDRAERKQNERGAWEGEVTPSTGNETEAGLVSAADLFGQPPSK